MIFWRTILFAEAVLVLQAQAPTPTLYPSQPRSPSDVQSSVPLYQVSVVQGSATAINYRNLTSTTRIEMKGTVLGPKASGVAKVKSVAGKIMISAKFKEIPPATTYGPEYLTYVLWGISPEGRATNLGELAVKHGKGKVKVEESLQTFGLVVTAEPYFAVSQPSDVVVLENVPDKHASVQMELIDAKYELLKRGQYTFNPNSGSPIPNDEKTLIEVKQARNAVRIARGSGASTFAPEPFAKSEEYLQQSELDSGSHKHRVMMARESIQRAEDARAISVKRQEVERAAVAEKLASDNLAQAKQETADAQSEASRQNSSAQAENAGLRTQLGAAQRDVGAANAAQESANRQARAAEADNEGLRAELMTQLNAVLQTRATARGLIVNLSGVHFQNGKATLQPEAREKLAKIAGILSSHKGLRIEAEGYTDSTGTEAFNQRLSEQRAKNAKTYLVSQGVPSRAITSKGFGVENPIATNDTDDGRKENRRVELVVTGEGLTSSQPDGQ